MNLLYTSQLSRTEYLNLLLAFIIPAAICLCFVSNLFLDPDIGWHIKAGEKIWEDMRLPFSDPFTFTADQRWYNISWLWDVGIYLIYKVFGVPGLRYVQTLLVASIVAGIYATLRAWKSIKFNHDTIIIVTAVSGLIIWDLSYLRPQLITYLLALITLVLLGKRLHWSSYLVVPIIILWANVHGSFIIAYTVIGSFMIQTWYEKDYAWMCALAKILALSVLGSLVNPLGYHIYYAILRTAHSVIMEYILEWLPFTFGRDYSSSLAVLIVLLLGGFLQNRIPVAYRVLALLWLVASLCSRRSFGYFAVLGVPYLGYILQSITEKYPSKYRMASLGKGLILIVGISAVYMHNVIRSNQSIIAQVPIESVQFLEYYCHNALIFNDYNVGGYLALWNANNNKYFVDGRAGTAFSEKFLKKYLEGTYGGNNIKELLSPYEVDAAIVGVSLREKASYIEYFSRWKLVYKDDKASVYFKHGGRCSSPGGK